MKAAFLLLFAVLNIIGLMAASIFSLILAFGTPTGTDLQQFGMISLIFVPTWALFGIRIYQHIRSFK